MMNRDERSTIRHGLFLAEVFALLVAVFIALPAWAESPTVKEATLLFVQNAEGVTYRDGRLTLDGVSPTTIFFSDRPERVAGHVTVADFLRSWSEGADSFEKDPPNAVLSVLNEATGGFYDL